MADTVNNLRWTSGKDIFDGLTGLDLAEEVCKGMFVFKDIIAMDDSSMPRFIWVFELSCGCDTQAVTSITEYFQNQNYNVLPNKGFPAIVISENLYVMK